ncbi:MAG: FliI/YscN family ATPase [Sedimentisphaerales bacterium]|nr:FliI/YscN family ATPase [Sedimentisphaerales bacterium]
MNQQQKPSDLFDFDALHARLQQTRLVTRKGTIQRVSGLTVESSGPDIGMGQPCEIRLRDNRVIPAEVIGFRGSNLVLLPLDHLDGISPGDTVAALNQPRCICLGPHITGRVIDGMGRPIDGKGPLQGQEVRSLDNPSPKPLQRRMISEPLPLGIRSIDGILTCGKGQRVGIFSGSGVGKSVLLGEIANGSDAQVNVVALVGERGREVREFLEKDLGPEGLARSVIIVATSDSAAIQRIKAGFTAVTIAEYFRDRGMDVLFMMDSLTRFSQAQREIGLAAGEPPATKGYCPSVFALLPRLLERLGCSDRGSITGILTVLAEADDLNDPVADSARSLLDGHIVLSRKLADRGHYPAIDILQSVSRLMPSVTTEEHRKAALKFREIYATYIDAEDLISIGAFSPGSNRRIDGSVALIDRIQDFLVQPVRQRSRLPETVSRLREIADSWDTLLSDHPAALSAQKATAGR